MSSKDGGPAFPQSYVNGAYPLGMSLREYAAIKLMQPDSDCKWLDEMILKAKRDWFAGMALQKLTLTINRDHTLVSDAVMVADFAFCIADAMIAAREITPEGE